ncbi:MAG TPA: biopolymer transporter ExbB, partial [Pantoea sp.]|nr:biopolymer transporter ExbB [Pantoea sp.]
YKASLGDVAAQIMLLQSRDIDLGNLNAKSAEARPTAQKLRVG